MKSEFHFFTIIYHKFIKCIFGTLLLPLILSYPQEINILAPNYGEFVGSENRYEIKFTSPDINKIKIEYSTDNGRTWSDENIERPSSRADYSHASWEVPKASSDSCFVKVSKTDNDSVKALSGRFTIFPSITDSIMINQIKYFFRNDGLSSADPKQDFGSGLLWPGGENASQSAVFLDGFTIGGIVDGEVYANGSTWRSGLIPGVINSDGTPSNPTDSLFKIWKIRKDWETLNPGPFKSQLEHDYNNWPGNIGAPFEDVDNNNVYDPTIDQPKILGDETNWFVCNDLDSSRSFNHYSNFPIGLEIQYTIYGYHNEDYLKDVLFYKYKVINKGKETLDNAIVSIWSDFDLGSATDDYVGCDTTLNLGYGYNGFEEDGIYGIPPAIGYLLLQGPIVETSEEDSAFFDGKWNRSSKNLKMTSFGPLIKHWLDGISDCSIKEELYNNMQGKKTLHGEPLVDPNTGFSTVFGLAGDPVNGIGWYEGEGFPGGEIPYDRRMHVNSGGFNLASGDTQEVVFATIMARGIDRLNSVTELKNKAKKVINFYYKDSLVSTNLIEPIPNNFSLSQNYPNPFNPTTTIEYTISSSTVILSGAKNPGDFSSQSSKTNGAPQNDNSNVSLKIYDVLGREVHTLVNQPQNPGKYSVQFNAENLASGIYFYQLTAGASIGSATGFVETKKMILLR